MYVKWSTVFNLIDFSYHIEYNILHMRSPFLQEAWINKARNERGEEKNIDMPEGYERDIRIYKMLEKRASENSLQYIDETRAEGIRTYFNEVKNSIFKYNNAILAYNKEKMSDFSKDDMENADRARRHLHDGLITNLDILARIMKEAGLDISWRHAIMDRKEVQRWSQNVVYYLQKEESEE